MEPTPQMPNLRSAITTSNSGRLISSVNQSKGKKVIIKKRLKRYK